MTVRFLPFILLIIACSSAIQAEPQMDSSAQLLAELHKLKTRSAQKESCQENTKSILKMLELYDSLISRNSNDLGQFQNIPDSGTDPLPPALQEMIEKSQTDLLDWMLEASELRLDSLAWDPYWKIMIFPNPPPAEQIQALSQLLEQCGPYLRILGQSLDPLQLVLEQDSNGDWNDRFGKTGFYDRVKRLRDAMILTQAKYCFFQACAGSCTASDTSDRTEALRQAMQPLHLFMQRLPDRQSAVHRLWYSRLSRMAAKNNSAYIRTAQETLAAIENELLDPELYYPIQIEGVLCLKEMSPPDTHTIVQKIDCLKQSLYDKLPGNPSLFNFLIQLAILEGQIQSQGENDSISQPLANAIHFPSLEPLHDLARRFPQYQDLLSDTLGVFLIHQTGDPKARPLEHWDPSDLLAAARYGQTFPALYPQSLLLYETFLRSTPDDHPQFPAGLYQAGLLQYQYAKSLPENSDETDARYLAANRHWTRLARQFPQWKSACGPQELSSETVLQNASAIACQLYQKAPQSYQTVTCETLELLVGQWDETAQAPSGPFCQSDFARQSRYNYALLLLADKQYNTAARWFGVVPDKDPRKASARYYAIYSEKCRLDSSSLSASPKSPLYDEWIRQLMDLIQAAHSSSSLEFLTDSSVSANAVLLAVSLYLEMSPPKPEQALALLGQQQNTLIQLTPSNQRHLQYLHANALYQCNHFDRAIALLAKDFQTSNPPSEIDLSLLRLSLQILISFHQELLSLQGIADYASLQNKLSLAIPFSQVILANPQIRSNDTLLLTAHQSLLQLLSLQAAIQAQTASSSPALENILKRASPVLSFCQNHPQAADTLWLIRCEALLAFAGQDYAASQALWTRIRQSTDPSQDRQSALDWWQARYFGILCLDRLGRSDEAAHSLAVLSKTYSIDQCPWKTALRHLEESFANSN